MCECVRQKTEREANLLFEYAVKEETRELEIFGYVGWLFKQRELTKAQNQLRHLMTIMAYTIIYYYFYLFQRFHCLQASLHINSTPSQF